MSQPTFGPSNTAFAQNSRSFANMGTPTTSDNKSNGNAVSSTHTTKRGGWGSNNNIWGSGSWSNGVNSRDATRDSSRSRDARSPGSAEGGVECKTGSGSLVDSSVSDAWTSKTSWGAKRSLPPGRSMSQAQNTESSAFKARSASTFAMPSFGNSMTQPSTFGSRAPPISLNNPTPPAPARAESTFASTFGFHNRSSEEPPRVYTKFNRPGDSTMRKLPDSAKDGAWADDSPTEERKSFSAFFGSHRGSAPVSRDGSIPSSFHGDEQSLFTLPDYSRTSQRPTQDNSRAPSISSQANGTQTHNTFLNSNFNRLASQLNQLDLTHNDRPLSSHNGSNGYGGTLHHPSPGSATSPFSRAALPGSSFTDDAGYMNTYDGYGYQSPQPESVYHLDFTPNMLGARDPQGHVGSDYGQRRHRANWSLPSQPMELQPGARSNASWNMFANSTPVNQGRLFDQQEQSAYPDVRMHHQQILGQLRNSLQVVYSPYGIQPGFPINGNNGFIPVMMNGPPVDAVGEVFDTDSRTTGQVQSFLLIDFKANAKQKHFQLKDIYDHIPEFSGDQHGSRFIQTKLETANSDEKERVFQEIEPNAIQLMTDVFGNYVIQKFFEHGDQRHKKILANKMRGEVLNLSTSMYGCRVVQKALDHVLVDQQHELVSELEGHVVECVKEQNGNHVIQKAIERCPPSTIDFIIRALRGEVHSLSIHSYGCRVIQRCLERCEPAPKAMIMAELMGCMNDLIADQYGNYVVQHVVQHDEGEAKFLVLDSVGRSLETYSKHKFASNVVEKCLEKSSDEWRRQVVWTLAHGHSQRSEGEGAFVSMIKDSYGNYVIQKLLDTLCVEDYLQFVEYLQPALSHAKRTGCGKQVLSIEKNMHKFPPFRGGPTNGSTYNTHNYRMPIPQFAQKPIDSAATTPPPTLKSDRGSLQSSALQSIDGDTVEGAHALVSRKLRDHSPGNYYR